MRIFYATALIAIIALLAAAVIYFSYDGSSLKVSRQISFSAALQWVITGGYFLTFLGMFLFGPIIISAAAFAAYLGYFNIWLIFAIAVFGDLFVDLILYAMGYFGRVAVIEKYEHRFGMSDEKIKKIGEMIHSNPVKTLTVIKLAPVLPLPGLMLVGSIRMPVRKFISINFWISLLKAVFFMAVGYYFGQIYDSISHYIKNAEYALLIALLSAIVIFYVYKKITVRISKKLEKG